MKNILLVFLAVAGLQSAPALAKGWYLGIAAGRADFASGEATLDYSDNTRAGIANVDANGRDSAFAIRLGATLHPNLAIEVARYDFGKYPFDVIAPPRERFSGSAKVSSYGAALVGILPLDAVDLYARLGYARTRLKFAAQRADASASSTARQTEVYGGIGARWSITREIGVFAEYQAHDKVDVRAVFVGLDTRF